MKINSGFTLVEVLVAVAVTSVVFTSLISIAATSLRNSNVNIRKTIGAHMADGLQEWLKGMKEDNWDDFKSRQGTWCFNDDPIIESWSADYPNGPCGVVYAVKNNFKYKRQVTISMTDEIISSRVEFYWDNTNENNKIINETYYSQW